jgi:hypothetical protein
MNEQLIEAREELKRLEHILYVSLKYTRTVDVLINALNRIITIFDLIIEALLEKAIDEGKLNVLPKSPALRSRKLGLLMEDDEELKKFLRFYLFIRTILNSEYAKRREYRRHVTLIVDGENMTTEIDSDNLLNCEKYSHKFLEYGREHIEGKVEED